MVICIPAKMGSEGVALKNLRDLGGYPLIMWTIAAARLLELPTYIMTDGADVMEQYGAMVTDVIMCEQKGDHYLINRLCDFLNDNPVVVYLRPSTPLRDINTLKKAIDYFNQRGDLYSLRSAHPMTEPCGKMYAYKDIYIPALGGTHDGANRPRQELQQTYHPNGYIDIVKTERIAEGLFLENFSLFVTEKMTEIDTEEDLEYAKYLVARYGHPLLDYIKATL